MTQPVRFGLIGSGMAADRYYAPAFSEVPETVLAACYDARPDRARQFAADNGCEPHARLEELLARPDIEAVIVATQVQDHAGPAIAACRAGKHVLCEKPMATSLAEADAMIAAARAAGVALGGIFQMRMSNHFSWMRDSISEGRLGRIHTADIALRVPLNPTGREERPDLPGRLVNILSHDIDFAMGLCGPVAKIELARVEYRHPRLQPPFEDMALAVWRFESGARGTVNLCCAGGYIPPGERSMLIVGESGAAMLRDLRIESMFEIDATGASRPVDVPPLRAEGHAGQLRDFALAIRAGRQPMITGEQHRESLRMIAEILAFPLQSTD